MNLRRRLCVHEWADGLTAMEEEVCACRHCGLTYGAWRARLWKLRAGLSLLALTAIAAAMTLAQPWHAIALTAATALACVLFASFL